MKKSKISYRFILILLGVLIVPISACEDLLEKRPDTGGARIPTEQLVENREDLQELLNSAYDVLGNTYNGDLQNLINCLNDNLVRPVQQDDLTSVWLRSTSIFNGSMSTVFNNLYFTVFRCNTVFEEVDNIELSSLERNRFLGEASFLRALAHFEAVRGWAQPYGYTPNNSHPGVAIQLENSVENTERSTVQEVYSQILSDIIVAKELLPETNPEGSPYANKWAALALEAEIRFQMHQYDLAYQLANEVIEMGPY
ncbi:MAG TPA: RagB/SusD family nutrient uptake outer membrane protein, partial [Cryomorphaceae bacterium]|nr:RagB/SusD family nutrient uptake outer membrane protein [Cryomorphaceae bacterium]